MTTQTVLHPRKRNKRHCLDRRQDKFRDALDTQREARSSVSAARANRTAQVAAAQLGSVAKIVTAQLQQCFAFLSFPWEWPAFLKELGIMIGSWIRFDLP